MAPRGSHAALRVSGGTVRVALVAETTDMAPQPTVPESTTTVPPESPTTPTETTPPLSSPESSSPETPSTTTPTTTSSAPSNSPDPNALRELQPVKPTPRGIPASKPANRPVPLNPKQTRHVKRLSGRIRRAVQVPTGCEASM